MKVLRRIGPGDREFVRSKILAVAYVSPHRLVEQIEIGIKAATKLDMIQRAHYKPDHLSPQQKAALISLIQQNPEQKTREIRAKDFAQFKTAGLAFDMVVMVGENDSLDSLYSEIIECWYRNKQRFLNGNFAQTPQQGLVLQYPEYDWDLGEAYREFCK